MQLADKVNKHFNKDTSIKISPFTGACGKAISQSKVFTIASFIVPQLIHVTIN